MQETSSGWRLNENQTSDIIIEEMETALRKEVSKFSRGSQVRRIHTPKQTEEDDYWRGQIDLEDTSEGNFKVVILPEKEGLTKVINEDITQHHKTGNVGGKNRRVAEMSVINRTSTISDRKVTEMNEFTGSDRVLSSSVKQSKYGEKVPEASSKEEKRTRRNVEILTAPKGKNVEKKTVGSTALLSTEESDDNGRIPHADENRVERKKDAFSNVSTAMENHALNFSTPPDSFQDLGSGIHATAYTFVVSHHKSSGKISCSKRPGSFDLGSFDRMDLPSQPIASVNTIT